MKFALHHPSYSFNGTGTQFSDSMVSLALELERAGFDAMTVMDHYHQIAGVGIPSAPMMESWTTLSFLAGVTSRLRLGTLVTGVVYRNPATVAKIAATLDVLSKGRVILGIGASWYEEEARAYGVPFPPLRERMDRLEEAVQLILAMWSGERATFNGKYYQVKDAYCNPKPLQQPHPPILIGGSGPKRTLRIVAKYGNACNLSGGPEAVKKSLDILREHCRAVKSDYDSILKTKTTRFVIAEDKATLQKRMDELMPGVPDKERRERAIYGTPEEVKRQIAEFEAIGVQYMTISCPTSYELESVKLFGREIIRGSD